MRWSPGEGPTHLRSDDRMPTDRWSLSQLTRREFVGALAAPVLLMRAAARRVRTTRGASRCRAARPSASSPQPAMRPTSADLISRGLPRARGEPRRQAGVPEAEHGRVPARHRHQHASARGRRRGASRCLAPAPREVVVGEGPGHRRDIEYLLAATGLDDQCARIAAAVRRSQPRRCAEGAAAEPIHRDRTRSRCRSSCCRSDFIVSMPKLKTHHWAGMTAQHEEPVRHRAGSRLRLAEEHAAPPRHRRTRSSISTATIRPHLAIVDAVVGDGRRRPDHGTAAADRVRGDGDAIRSPWTPPAPGSSGSIPTASTICTRRRNSSASSTPAASTSAASRCRDTPRDSRSSPALEYLRQQT